MQFNKAYVLCPVNQTTGGPEALHQLASALKLQGIEAYISYFDRNGKPVGCNVPSAYQIYDVAVAISVEDAKDNLVVIPETATYLLEHYVSACRVIWWLSIDNYFVVCGSWIKRLLFYVLRRKIFFKFGIFYPNLIHVAQSYYATQRLSVLGVQKSYLLTDYLRDSFLENSDCSICQKENIVVYNPKKGIKTTKMIIKNSVGIDLEWVPLINMTHDQVINLLKRAKIYIDFGEHPGRDRIPREAALCGCVVITGQRGSAANEIDLPIPQSYKFSDFSQYDAVCQMINDVLENFAEHHLAFEGYRNWVRQNKSHFFQEVKDLINYEC